MNNWDHLWDTREKRNCLLCIGMDIFFVFMSIIHLYLGFVLIQAHNYDQIFDLLSQPIVSWALLGKIVLNGMSLVTLDAGLFLTQFFKSFSLYEGVSLIMMVLILFAKPITSLEKRNYRMTMINALAYGFILICLLGILLLSFQAGSLFDVLKYLHLLGYLLMGLNLFLVILNGYALCQMLVVDYPDALQVELEVVE